MRHNLLAEMARKKVSKKNLYQFLGISQRTLYDKIQGKTDFTFKEAMTIQSEFFPELTIQYLFDDDTER